MRTPCRRLAPALLALLAAACASTTPVVLSDRFEDWDGDHDGLIGTREFADAFTRAGLFAAWDRDGDGQVGDDEFSRTAFLAWDRDGDGRLTDREWRASVLRWDDVGVDFGPFDAWDTDRDRHIDAREFVARVDGSGLYAAWDLDLDRSITAAELSEGLYRLADLDESGYLDAAEWDDGALLTLHTGARAPIRSGEPI